MATESEVLLTAEETAKWARISLRHFWRLIASGEFPQGIRLGGRRVWHREELDAWFREMSRQSKG